MALFKYLKWETTMLLDKQTWNATAKFKFRGRFFYGRFGAKQPNLKSANISGYKLFLMKSEVRMIKI